jgi:beta-lactamase class A
MRRRGTSEAPDLPSDRRYRIILYALILSLGANILLGSSSIKKLSANDYPLLSKRLFAENPNNIILNFTSLRKHLNDYVKSTPVKTGVYFEYLPTGNSIGVNEKEVFFTASLIKLPVVMRTYFLIDQGKIKSTQVVTLQEKQLDKGFGDLWMRGAGAEVSVRDLTDAVLTDSDNTAFRALSDLIATFNSDATDTRSVLDVYNSLDIPNDEAGGNAGITPKNFSSILRSLYLSAYLPYKYSNHILEHLASSKFDDWLPEPIPDDIKVAHKFGLYNAEPHEFSVHSDCGIVYHPKRPYALCVMVNTHEEQIARDIIRTISRTTYDYVHNVAYTAGR